MRQFTPHAFALLRIISGLMFACHGAQKLLGWPARQGPAPALASLFGLGAVIELVGGLMIAIGLFAGIAAFIASGEMAAAYLKVHFPNGPIPLLNKGELAVLYCFVFLSIAVHGSGIWSVDSVFRKAEPSRGI
jgi:putative oxidoreductase